MEKREVIATIAWLSIGVFVLFSALRLGVGTCRNPGSGFVPFCASLLFLATAVLAMARGRGRCQPNDVTTSETRPNYLAVMVVIGVCVLYLLVLEKVGFLPATLGLMLTLFALRRLPPSLIVLATAATVFGSYVLFHILLKVPLPRGVFSF